MASPCKVFTFTNVETEKGVLANIASAAQSGGWTVDKDAVVTDGELYLHSTGNGAQQLYFSLRLEASLDTTPVFNLLAHGNTGFDAAKAWNEQPGRFTERIQPQYNKYQCIKPLFSDYRSSSDPSSRYGSAAWWIVPPVAEQVVLVCPTFVLTALRVVHPQEDRTFSGWVPFLFGAADSFRTGETELNMVLSSTWGVCSHYGTMLSMMFPVNSSSNYSNSCADKPCNTIGLLYGGGNADQLSETKTDRGYTGYPNCVVRSSIFSTPSRYTTGYAYGTTASHYNETLQSILKAFVAPQVLVYDAALLQNPGTLRSVLVKPLLYVCPKNGTVEIVGELPYYAVNMTGLAPKDILRFGGRSFFILPNIRDTDRIGLAVEVESA